MNAHSIALFFVSYPGMVIAGGIYAAAAYSAVRYVHRSPWTPLCLIVQLCSLLEFPELISSALPFEESLSHELAFYSLLAMCLTGIAAGIIAALTPEERRSYFGPLV